MLGRSFWLLCSVSVHLHEEPSQRQSTQTPQPITRIQKARTRGGLSRQRPGSRNAHQQEAQEKPVLRTSSYEVKLYWHRISYRPGTFAPLNTQGNCKSLRFREEQAITSDYLLNWLLCLWVFFLSPCPLHTYCKTFLNSLFSYDLIWGDSHRTAAS